MGNPTTYRGKTLEWKYGRRLMKYGGNTFKYDSSGLRVGKNTITYLHDVKGRLVKQSNGFEFIYDNMGLLGLKYDGQTYIYRKNIQGDIIAILDSTGKAVVEYNYNAWGEFSTSGSNLTLGYLNPFRYRGYYYDGETSLYYLETRYYDYCTGRFISMDSLDYLDPTYLNGMHPYVYCNNNPVNYCDPTGESAIVIGLGALFALLAVGIIETTFHTIENAVTNIGNFVGDVVTDLSGSIIYDRVNISSSIGDISVSHDVSNSLMLNELPNIFLRQGKDVGFDSQFRGIPDEELEKLKHEAEKRGNKELVLKIIREQKMRGLRNKRKKRGGPHMRGLLFLFLVEEYLRRNID